MIVAHTKSIWHTFGKGAGFVVGYGIFTTILYFILSFFEKIPATWSYVHIALITLAIIVAGFLVRRFLQ